MKSICEFMNKIIIRNTRRLSCLFKAYFVSFFWNTWHFKCSVLLHLNVC